MRLLRELGVLLILLCALRGDAMKQLLFALMILFTVSVMANAQACPGGFWGNGQCIAPCESPLVNPNVSLAFYGYFCQAQPPCENNYVYCYPAFTAYDNAYNQYCGVITDWNDGGCYEQPPGLDRFGPRRRDIREPALPWGTLLHRRHEIIMAQARPGAKCSFTKHYRQYRAKHAKA